MAEHQRPDHRVEHAVGPAGIGDVPIVVVWTQVDRVKHVGGDGQKQRERIAHALRFPSRAGGEEHDERVASLQHDRREVARLRCDRFGEAIADSQDVRTVRHVLQLRAVGDVGDDEFRLAAAGRGDAALDCRRPEGREERLVHRADAPRAEDDRE